MSKNNSPQSGRNTTTQNDTSSRLPAAPRNPNNDHHDHTQNRIQQEQPDITPTDHSNSTDPSRTLTQISLIVLPVDSDSTTIRRERLIVRQRSLNSILDEAISISEEMLSEIRNETVQRIDAIEIAPRVDCSSDDDDGESSGNHYQLPKQ